MPSQNRSRHALLSKIKPSPYFSIPLPLSPPRESIFDLRCCLFSIIPRRLFRLTADTPHLCAPYHAFGIFSLTGAPPLMITPSFIFHYMRLFITALCLCSKTAYFDFSPLVHQLLAFISRCRYSTTLYVFLVSRYDYDGFFAPRRAARPAAAHDVFRKLQACRFDKRF